MEKEKKKKKKTVIRTNLWLPKGVTKVWAPPLRALWRLLDLALNQKVITFLVLYCKNKNANKKKETHLRTPQCPLSLSLSL